MSSENSHIIFDVLPDLGKLNALVKNIMKQTGIDNANEAIRSINAGEWGFVRSVRRILEHESTVNFEAYHAFNVSEKIHLVRYLNDNFKNWFGNMSVSSSEACTLNVARLKENATDYSTEDYPGIIPEVGEDKCEIGAGAVLQGVEKGTWSKDRWYFTYAKDSAGVRRAVGWRWDGDGWCVCAYSVPDPTRWSAGSRLVSRNG
jgi:hypothetical protein